MKSTGDHKRILLLYYSFSSQTNNVVQALIGGLEECGIEVARERLIPQDPIRFPIGSVFGTLVMMVKTFLRIRVPIEPISEQCFEKYDLIILAGPTWSYNPSGPVLALLDRDGDRLFAGQKVLPLISCRGYWRMHAWGLKRLLRKCGGVIANLIVFSHPNKEPWRTLGVFLKLAGRTPERTTWMAHQYRKYGHTREQLDEAKRFGRIIGQEMTGLGNLEYIDFSTPLARP